MTNTNSKKKNKQQLQKIKELLNEVPHDTLWGVAIQRVLKCESECDIYTLLSNILCQVKVNEREMKKLLGEELITQIKLFTSQINQSGCKQ